MADLTGDIDTDKTKVRSSTTQLQCLSIRTKINSTQGWRNSRQMYALYSYTCLVARDVVKVVNATFEP